MYQWLKHQKPKDYKVYLASDVLEKLHYSTREDKSRRIGDIILIPNGNKIFGRPNAKRPKGHHGYDPREVSEMKATFFAFGPAFKTKKKICTFENIHI